MKVSLEIHPEAVSDIIASAQWYEDKQAGLGGEFIAEVNRRIDELAEVALTFRLRHRRKRVRWTYPRRFPHRICYYVQEQTVRVFAVVHAARHDYAWRKRL